MKKLSLVLAAFLPMVFVSVSSATEIDRVVAVVGQNVVTLSELQSEMAPMLNELNRRYQGEELARAQEKLKKASINGLVDKYLQLQEAKIEGVEVAKEEVDAAIDDIMNKNHMDKAAFDAALENEGYVAEDYKKNLADQLLIMRLVSRTVKSKVTIKDEEIEKYYNENKSKFAQPESVKVAHILFPAKDSDMEKALKSANDARAEIARGTAFEEMAAKCTGDENASKSCVLGTFGKGELAPEIEAAAFDLKQGEVSQPIKSYNGYQLIKVMEKTEAAAKSLKDARAAIVEELSSKQGEVLFAKWIKDLRKKTYVEVRE